MRTFQHQSPVEHAERKRDSHLNKILFIHLTNAKGWITYSNHYSIFKSNGSVLANVFQSIEMFGSPSHPLTANIVKIWNVNCALWHGHVSVTDLFFFLFGRAENDRHRKTTQRMWPFRVKCIQKIFIYAMYMRCSNVIIMRYYPKKKEKRKKKCWVVPHTRRQRRRLQSPIVR